MSTTAQEYKSKKSIRHAKKSTRVVRRCWRCGRKNGYMRKFGLCRVCFREMANQGDIPGIKKASW